MGISNETAQTNHLYHIGPMVEFAIAYVLVCSALVLVVYRVSKRMSGRIVILWLSFLLSSAYMFWRTRYTLEWGTFVEAIGSLILLGSEYLGYIQQGLFYLLMARGTEVKQDVPDALDTYPSVDVLVTTFNEPLSVLRRTLTACTYLDYPMDKLNIYVCDDGGRVAVKSLAKNMGIHYIARDEHDHAKAGNLNYAMTCSQGDLVLTLDADMVPKSTFLKQTVPYFNQPKVGFVQAPQLFFNPDPFQHNLSSVRHVSNEQDFFMVEMQSAKNRFNATMYIGSNCLFSRDALNDIGGFATGSITEDVATGMLLQAKGYQTFFVKEALAKGLSPESFSEMLRQRDRWCRGNIQAVQKWDPMTLRGLTWVQRLLYQSGVLYWYFGIQKIAYILAPIVFLDFGLKTLNASVLGLAVFWLPQFLSTLLSFRRIASGRRTTFWSHIYETAMAPTLAVSAIRETLFTNLSGTKFRVTSKGIANTHIHIVWGVFAPYMILFAGTIFGYVHQLMLLGTGHVIPSYDWIVDFWGGYNLLSIVASLFVSIELPRPRKSERFSIHAAVRLESGTTKHYGTSVDMSENGARIRLNGTDILMNGDYTLHIDGINGSFPVKLVSVNGVDVRATWRDLPDLQYKGLVRLLFDRPENVMDEFEREGGSWILPTLIRSMRSHWKASPVSRFKGSRQKDVSERYGVVPK